MFLISRTFSRQHTFPLCGVRPAIASNDANERPATTVETLFKECPSGSNNKITYTLQDGEQGWYKVVTSAEPWPNGVTSTAGAVGGATEYRLYLHPGSTIVLWNSFKGGTNAMDNSGTAAWGGSASMDGTIKQGGAGAGSGYSGTPGGTGSTSVSGGAGFIAALGKMSEPTYSAGVPMVIKIIQGYSYNPSLVYLQENNNPITLTRTPASDSANGRAWTGYIPDPASSTGGTIAVTGFTEGHLTYVGDAITIYETNDQTTPIQVTTVSEVTKTTYYIQTTDPNSILQGYPILSTTGVEVGKAGAVQTTYGLKGFTYNGNTYFYDEKAVASYSNQIYYAWKVRTFTNKPYRLVYVNSSDTAIWQTTNKYPGQNGVFYYEKIRDKMCFSGELDTRMGQKFRVPEKDMAAPRVALGVTNYKNTSFSPTSNNGFAGTGCYAKVLAGGGGNMSTANGLRGGGALGSVLKGVGEFFNNITDWKYRVGPADSFGAANAKEGAWCIVDSNDNYAVHGTGGGGTANGSSVTQVYKITDSTDETKYAQKIYFPASDQGYTVTFSLNDTPVPGSWEIRPSHKITERFFPDVKQEDVLTMEMHGDNGSVIINTYTISTETIAFGLWPDTAPWKVREYSGTRDVQLGFLPGYTYGVSLVSGGGAGGGSTGGTSTGYAGAGGSSDLRKIRFAPTDQAIGRVHIGKGGVKSTNGGTGASGQYYGSAGGGAGEPTYITFNKDVTVEALPMRLYSWTNGSTVMYTRNSAPNEVGKLTKFCDANGILNGKTGYLSNTSPKRIICQQDGLEYVTVAESGNANIDINITGNVQMVFNPASGGGGGAGGNPYYWRQGTGGGGGGGGAWYRIDFENKMFYILPGVNGGRAYGYSAGNSPTAPSNNTIDGYYVYGRKGANGAGRSGGSGGRGYGAGGGGGGAGRNDSGSPCGAGGGGAPGDERGRWGAYNNGTNTDAHLPLRQVDASGKLLEYGVGGSGYAGSSQPDSYYNGMDGWAYLYRFDVPASTTDCGLVGAGGVESPEWTSIIRTPEAHNYYSAYISAINNEYYFFKASGILKTSDFVTFTTVGTPDIPSFGTNVVYHNGTYIAGANDAVYYNNGNAILDYGKIYSSTDALTWTMVNERHGNNIIWGNNEYITMYYDKDTELYYVVQSSDGTTWTNQQITHSIPVGIFASVATTTLVWDGYRYVAYIDGSDANHNPFTYMIFSSDGVTWSNGGITNVRIYSAPRNLFGFVDDKYVFLDNLFAYYTSSDGVNWTLSVNNITLNTIAEGNVGLTHTCCLDGTTMTVVVQGNGSDPFALYTFIGEPGATEQGVTETIDCGSVIDTEITETIDNGAL